MERSSVMSPFMKVKGYVEWDWQRLLECEYIPSGHLEGIYTCTCLLFSILQFNLSSLINLTNNKPTNNVRTTEQTTSPRRGSGYVISLLTLVCHLGPKSWSTAIKETYFINGDGNKVEKDDNGQDISGLNANTDCKPTPPLACPHISSKNIADKNQLTSPTSKMARGSTKLWIFPRDWTRERFSDPGLNVRITAGGNGGGNGAWSHGQMMRRICFCTL